MTSTLRKTKDNFMFEYAGHRLTRDMVWQFDPIQEESRLLSPVRVLLSDPNSNSSRFALVGIDRETGALSRVNFSNDHVMKNLDAWVKYAQLILW